MKKILFLMFLSAFLFISCDNYSLRLAGKVNQEPTVTLEQKLSQKMAEMTEVAELGSVEYTVTKVVKASDDPSWYKVGDRKILFNCTAYLKAGIDLNKIDMTKVVVDEEKKSVVLTLPKAELLSLNMPPDKSTLVYENIATFRSKFTTAEKNRLLQLGEKSIRNDVTNLGILADAEKNTSSFFKSLLAQLGFEIITIKFE